MKPFSWFVGLSLFSASMLMGQEASPFAFDIGAGFTKAVGTTAQNVDDAGWNLRAGFGVKKFPKFNNFLPGVGVMVDVGYDRFNVQSSVLNAVGAPNGDVQIFSAMVNPIVHLSPIGHVGAYLTGGGGYIRQYQEFTAPTVATASVFNPFFGFHPVLVGATEILSSYSVNKPGYDVGGGLEFGTKFHGKLFAEARYYHMFNNGTHTDFIPVTFGFRW